MKSILFVTYGDSFRPPMALYILGHLAKDEGIELAVDSAHVKDGVGEPVTEKAITTLARYGIEGGTEYCSQMEWNMYDIYDFIVYMDDAARWPLFKIIGGDPDDKVHCFSEFIGMKGTIINPELTRDYDLSFKIQKAACEKILELIRGTRNE